jgi:phosphatidyl-myo-inositol dimannoside synthase
MEQCSDNCIGIVAIEYPPIKGGIATLTEDLARFAARRWPVCVFLIGPVQEVIQYDENIKVIPLGDLASPKKLYSALRQSRITHVLFNHQLCASFPVVIKCKSAGIRTYTYVHGKDINMDLKRRLGIRTRLRRFLTFKLQNGVLANSHSTQQIFNMGMRGVKLRIVHPGIWLLKEQQVLKQKRGDVIAIGRLVRRKGFDVLLEALACTDKSVTLTIIGDGPDREFLQNYAGRLGVQSRVRFLRGISNEKVQEELQSHRVFCLLPRVLPSGDVEGFGIVFTEAAAAGLPVVAGNSGGVPDAINDGVNGFLINPEDPKQAAQKLRLLLTDAELYDHMSKESHQWAKKFDWNQRNPERELCFS